MTTVYIAATAILAFPFLFPEEFIYWSRRIRKWIREDLRRRLTQEEWEAYRAEVPDF